MIIFPVLMTLLAPYLIVDAYQDEIDEILVVNMDLEEKTSNVRGRVATGESCDYVYLCNITSNIGCEDGSKFVIKQAANTHKKFLLLNGEAVLAFVTNGLKFTDCSSYRDITSTVDCKVVVGAADINLARSSLPGTNLQRKDSGYLEIPVVKTKNMNVNSREAKGQTLTGNPCEHINMCNIKQNRGCEDGSSMKIKAAANTRRQFLLLNGGPVLAFVSDGTKFASCSAFTEVTTQVDCKVTGALTDLELNGVSEKQRGFNYKYKVADEEHQTYMEKEEKSDGETVVGFYSYVDPTGALITVKYRAGPMGYTEVRDKQEGYLKIHQNSTP